MAKRENHYEAAFEHYLRSRQVPYLAVDEARRSLIREGSLKSLDFVISSSRWENWLIDVKGRLFPSGATYWKNWSTRDDLDSLTRWEQVFGQRFQGLLVFAYAVVGSQAPLPYAQLLEFRDRLYGFVAIRLRDYAAQARALSARWGTVGLPVATFRRLAAPLDEFL